MAKPLNWLRPDSQDFFDLCREIHQRLMRRAAPCVRVFQTAETELAHEVHRAYFQVQIGSTRGNHRLWRNKKAHETHKAQRSYNIIPNKNNGRNDTVPFFSLSVFIVGNQEHNIKPSSSMIDD